MTGVGEKTQGGVGDTGRKRNQTSANGEVVVKRESGGGGDEGGAVVAKRETTEGEEAEESDLGCSIMVHGYWCG